MFVRSCAVGLLMIGAVLTPAAYADGQADFRIAPKLGAVSLSLPTHATWQTKAVTADQTAVSMTLSVDVAPLLRNIKSISAKGLDRAKPCSELIKVRDAKAALTGPTSLSYDLSLHYAKRICAGGMPLELPAEVDCSSNIDVSSAGSVIAFDVRGARAQPCMIDGSSPALFQKAFTKIFKKHLVDLADQLPPEFRGATLEIKSLQFDTPPAASVLRVVVEGNMSPAQLNAMMQKLKSARSASAKHRNP